MSASDSSHLHPEVYITLILFIFQRLLPKDAPKPAQISANNSDEITQEIIEKCFLPFSANTSSTADNAKVSILAENAFRVLIKRNLENLENAVYHTKGLYAAVEDGIRARKLKIKRGKGKRGDAAITKEDIVNRQYLDASSARLNSLVKLVERSGRT